MMGSIPAAEKTPHFYDEDRKGKSLCEFMNDMDKTR